MTMGSFDSAATRPQVRNQHRVQVDLITGFQLLSIDSEARLAVQMTAPELFRQVSG